MIMERTLKLPSGNTVRAFRSGRSPKRAITFCFYRKGLGLRKDVTLSPEAALAMARLTLRFTGRKSLRAGK